VLLPQAACLDLEPDLTPVVLSGFLRVSSYYSPRERTLGTLRAFDLLTESEVRAETGQTRWRCQAVTKDRKNPNRIRIACRDEVEHKMVKRLIGAKLARGARALRDELYPIKVDNVNLLLLHNNVGLFGSKRRPVTCRGSH
jgi:hypothetical protein